VVGECPCAHILDRFFGKDRVAGQNLYVGYVVAISGDF
jgi:hypothetical protein